MNSVDFAKAIALSLILATTVVACKKNPKNITPIPGARNVLPGSSPSDLAGGAIGDGQNVSGRPLGEGDSVLPGREDDGNFWVDREAFRDQVVYFDFDSSTVKPGERAKVQAVAARLRGEGTTKVRVEGHCDERGTAEYNRALGERRALSVREVLITEGVSPDRIATLSFGEDKPSVLGSDDSAWAKNRRAEFVLLTPK